MPLRQHLTAVAVAAGLLAAGFWTPAAAQEPTDPDLLAYRAELARQCPEKHLEWLNPGWLADPIGEVFEHATPAQKAVHDRIYQEQCAHVEAGASCGNFANIKAAARLKLTKQQAADVCREPAVCTAFLECRSTRP
jgi:hypothetical protein